MDFLIRKSVFYISCKFGIKKGDWWNAGFLAKFQKNTVSSCNIQINEIVWFQCST